MVATAPGSIPAGLQNVDRDSIRLQLMLSAVVQLGGDVGGLRRVQQCECRVDIARDRRQHSGEDTEHGRQGAPPGLLLAAGKVFAFQVSDFVCQHSCQFRFVLGVIQQSVVYPDDTTGDCEGIQLWIVDHHQIQSPVLKSTVGGQPVAEVMQIILQQWIVIGVRLAPEQPQPGSTESPGLLWGQLAGDRPEVGQSRCGVRRGRYGRVCQ